jgi:transposase InsO family protein
MEWMPPPDGIAMCQDGDVCASHEWRGHPWKRLASSVSTFASTDFTGVLIDNKIATSMDGKGSWRDNVFVERLWRSVKYEEVYLRAYNSVCDARNRVLVLIREPTDQCRIRVGGISG